MRQDNATYLLALNRWSVGRILFGSTVAAPGSAMARKYRGMAFEIACAGRLDWGVSAGLSTLFHWASVPPIHIFTFSTSDRALTGTDHRYPALFKSSCSTPRATAQCHWVLIRYGTWVLAPLQAAGFSFSTFCKPSKDSSHKRRGSPRWPARERSLLPSWSTLGQSHTPSRQHTLPPSLSSLSTRPSLFSLPSLPSVFLCPLSSSQPHSISSPDSIAAKASSSQSSGVFVSTHDWTSSP